MRERGLASRRWRSAPGAGVSVLVITPAATGRCANPAGARAKRRAPASPRCGQLGRVAASSAARALSARRCRTRRLQGVSKIVCAGCGAGTRPAAVEGARCEPCAGSGRAGVPALRGAGGQLRRAAVRRACSPTGSPRCARRRSRSACPPGRIPVRAHGRAAAVEHAELARPRRRRARCSRDPHGPSSSSATTRWTRSEAAGVYLRAAFVEHGALGPRVVRRTGSRPRSTASSSGCRPGRTARTCAPTRTGRSCHDLARRERRGETTVSSQKYARPGSIVAVDLICWLHDRGLDSPRSPPRAPRHLAVVGQQHPRSHPRVPRRAQRGKLIPRCTHQSGTRCAAAPSDAEHASDPATAASDESLDPRDRVAGALVLLLAQPITRLMRLTPADVHTDQDVVCLRLGRDPVELPEPLGRLTAELAANRADSPRPQQRAARLAVPRAAPRRTAQRRAHAPPARAARDHRPPRPHRRARRPLPARPTGDPRRPARHLRAQRRPLGQALRRRMGRLCGRQLAAERAGRARTALAASAIEQAVRAERGRARGGGRRAAPRRRAVIALDGPLPGLSTSTPPGSRTRRGSSSPPTSPAPAGQR